MANVIAFETQKNWSYTAILSTPVLVILGSILHLFGSFKNASLVAIGIFSMAIFFGTHLLLKRKVKQDRQKFSKELKLRHDELHAKGIEIILLVLLLSLSLVGLFSLFK